MTCTRIKTFKKSCFRDQLKSFLTKSKFVFLIQNVSETTNTVQTKQTNQLSMYN